MTATDAALLGEATLAGLPADVARPAYDRRAHGIGIVHLGLGAFHRAHQAVYVDDMLATVGGDWRILGVSLRSHALSDALTRQDTLFTVETANERHSAFRVIGALAGAISAQADPAALLEAIAAPSTRLVTLTISEKGYCHAGADGGLDRHHPDIVHDLARPAVPRSAVGWLVAGLAARAGQHGDPLTIISCDNLPENGRVLRRVVRDFAALIDPALIDWVDRAVRFPSSMVDRIVPATTPADIEGAATRLGLTDAATVRTEPFRQWVIEDDFASARPALDRVGVQFVRDIRPYELAKLRLLNGSHSMLAYLGLAVGHEFVHQAVGDRVLRDLIEQAMIAESAPTLPLLPGFDVDAYRQALLDRFANPAVAHRLSQIAEDGSRKIPQRLIDPIRDQLARGGPVAGLAAGVGGWMCYVADRGGDVADPARAALIDMVTRTANDREAMMRGLLSVIAADDLADALQCRTAWLAALN